MNYPECIGEIRRRIAIREKRMALGDDVLYIGCEDPEYDSYTKNKLKEEILAKFKELEFTEQAAIDKTLADPRCNSVEIACDIYLVNLCSIEEV